MKIIDLKITYRCNNNCRYCCQNRNLRNLETDISLTRVKEVINSESSSTIHKVVLTGGEPTLNRELTDIAKYIKEIGIQNIQLQTNAKLLSNEDFLNNIISSGITSFGISLHGNTKEMHEAFTNTKNSFDDVVKSLKTLKKYNCHVALNCVITKHNIEHFPSICSFVQDNDLSSSLQFAFIHIIGEAQNRVSDYVSISKASNKIRELFLNHNYGIKISTEAIPLCLMKDCEEYVSELYNTHTVISFDYISRREFSIDNKSLFKTKFAKCRSCVFYPECEGVWTDYPELFGDEEFNPVYTFGRYNK